MNFSLPAQHYLEVIFLGLALLLLLTLLRKTKAENPYTVRDSLVSPAERSFLGCLDSVVPPDVRVFVKIRLADLFRVNPMENRSKWQSSFNRISSKHVDFVLCRSTDLKPLACIELDDKSHDRQKTISRDIQVNAVFANAGMPLIRIKAQRSYNPNELAEKIRNALS